MKHNNATLENLTRSSMQLNKGLLLLLGLALLLIGISYWAAQRLIEEQHEEVRFHFARLMENVQEHEAFLKTLSEQGALDQMLSAEHADLYLQKPVPQEGANVYEGQEFSYSMPFGLNFNHEKLAADELPKVFALGVHLASSYSAFWASSHYPAPQVFLFNAYDNFDINVPAAGHLRANLWTNGESYKTVGQRVFQHLAIEDGGSPDNQVYWEKYNVPPGETAPTSLLAYVNIHISPERLHIQDANSRMVVASLLDLSRLDDVDQTMKWSIDDHFTLISPTGAALIGSLKTDRPLHEGLNLNSDGMVFKVSTTTGEPWTGIYTISFKSYFGQDMWPLLSLLVLLLTGIGWTINRWYRNWIVLPAHLAHQSIAESDAFSRVVIDTAPTGLCVVRRTDFKVLLENQRAQEWQGTSKLVALLGRERNLAEAGEISLDIDGRHLHVGFISTRYKGQHALLCAFNDVTSHIEDVAALEQAKSAADAANEAKALFLATMSHEIRTPLYGVLGTLELLELTRLDQRQQEYLQTIQRSSTTLFQLISDVLDVSKIESGQMTIESIEFCPLQMIEDTLHTYAAFAERKGLLLYACIDAALPNLTVGDPLRIRQILNNLLSNAIKFTEAGRVVLRVRVLNTSDGHASLEWQVTDSGIGISQTQQEQLFEPFYQVRDASGEAGAGLGLAICWGLSEMMQGQIKIISEPGLGSSFSLQLDLKTRPGVLPECLDIQPATHVFVRAPAQELAQSVSDWLNRLGLSAQVAPAHLEQSHQDAILVDVLPCDSTTSWQGPRVRCVSSASSLPEYPAADWEVDAHDIQAIARTVSLAQQGRIVKTPRLEPAKARRLNLHILVAEDNPINQAIIKEQLEVLGCTVVVTCNGEQALHHWQPGVFDLVLTDVNMPVMNGYELARTLREHDPQIPIIGVTANAMREEGARCISVGMNAWIVKPLSLQTLREHLSKLCQVPFQATPAIAEPMPNLTQPQTRLDEIIQLSPKMRELFLTTMQQDMQRVTCALDIGDGKTVAERLHSIAGAMGAVQATTLAKACAELECELLENRITPPLTLKTRHLVQRLSNVLDALE